MTSTTTAASSAAATPHAAGSNYYGASRLVRALRFGLGASQRLWPALAVRAAYRLFGAPLPSKRLNRRHGPDAAWRHERWPFENASLGLYTRKEDAGTGTAARAATVLLIHGWGGHAGQLLALAQALAAA